MTDDSPSFSVIIPTHNRLKLVIRAIESALIGESSPTVEILVVDDASTDGTITTLREKYAHDPKVHLIRLEHNHGPSAARNRGLSHSNGQFVIFLDSDDMLMPHAFEYASAVFEQLPELQFLSLEGRLSLPSGSIEKNHIVRNGNPGWRGEGARSASLHRLGITPPAGMDEPERELEFGDLLPMIMFGDLFFLSGLFMRRSAAIATGPFNTRFSYLEDWEFCARLCTHGTGGYVDWVGFVRESGNPDQLCRTGTPWKEATMHHHILNALRESGFVMSTGHSHQWHRALGMAEYQLARSMLEYQHSRLARKYFLRALRHAYKPLKSLIWLLAGRHVQLFAGSGQSKRIVEKMGLAVYLTSALDFLNSCY